MARRMKLANTTCSRGEIKTFDRGVIVLQGVQHLHASPQITTVLTIDVVTSEVPLQVHI